MGEKINIEKITNDGRIAFGLLLSNWMLRSEWSQVQLQELSRACVGFATVHPTQLSRMRKVIDGKETTWAPGVMFFKSVALANLAVDRYQREKVLPDYAELYGDGKFRNPKLALEEVLRTGVVVRHADGEILDDVDFWAIYSGSQQPPTGWETKTDVHYEDLAPVVGGVIRSKLLQKGKDAVLIASGMPDHLRMVILGINTYTPTQLLKNREEIEQAMRPIFGSDFSLRDLVESH